MKKSRSCFLLNCQTLSESLYFWTFTFAETLPVPVAKERWTKLLKYIQKNVPEWAGLRVFELHDTHGLHVHLLTGRYVRVEILRRICKLVGFGRINVKRARQSMRYYLGKYLCKKRPEALKGARLWAAFGFDHTKVAEVVLQSLKSLIWKKAAGDFGWKGRIHFNQKRAVVNELFLLTISNDWPDGYGQNGVPYSDNSVRELLWSGADCPF